MMGRAREVTMDDGVIVSYRVLEGADPAVVILHGLAGSSREFLPTAQALIGIGRTVVLIDQRGHGMSTQFPVDVSREAFVSDVVHVISAEGLGPVDLVGQSMGAHTAMLVAASRPDLVRRLVLLECDAGGGSHHEAEVLGDYFRSWKVPYRTREEALTALGDDPLSQALVADLEEHPDGLYPRFDAGVMEQTILEVMSPRWAEWQSSTVSTMVVFAEHGEFTDEQKTRFVESRTDVARVDLSGASHDAHLDAFPQWIAALTTFIDAR
jgi:pimeloyl-ACP methyl ester carboxylesterase